MFGIRLGGFLLPGTPHHGRAKIIEVGIDAMGIVKYHNILDTATPKTYPEL